MAGWKFRAVRKFESLLQEIMLTTRKDLSCHQNARAASTKHSLLIIILYGVVDVLNVFNVDS